jgi:ketosteroid isomerase-like protein
VSRENVEIVKQALDAYPQRDIEAMRAVADPDIVLDWSASEGWMAGVYRGFAEVDRVWEGLWEAFEEIVTEDRYIDAGESVVVPDVSHLRGREGIEVSARATFVFTLRNRKITRICLYQETGQALKAVGLGP